MFVLDTILYKCRPDLEVRGRGGGIEAVCWNYKSRWQILQTTKQAFRLFNLLKESIDRAGSTDTVDITITGDFNFNMTHHTPNMINELMAEYSLSQLISDNTHFTEHSSSPLDLILVRNNDNNNNGCYRPLYSRSGSISLLHYDLT